MGLIIAGKLHFELHNRALEMCAAGCAQIDPSTMKLSPPVVAGVLWVWWWWWGKSLRRRVL